MKPLRDRLTYANIVATLALFVALGGSSYAVVSISGKQLKDRSVPGKKLKRNSVTGREIKESRLGTVRRARDAAKVGGVTAARLLLKCPTGTVPVAGGCVEAEPRPAAGYGGAARLCSQTDAHRPDRVQGRRLPTYGELQALLSFQEFTLAPGGELTSHALDNGSGTLQATYITDEAGSTGLTPDTFEGRKAFRCAVNPVN